MSIITVLLLLSVSMITSVQVNRRTIVDIPLTGLDSLFTNETNKKDLNAYNVKRFLSTRMFKLPFSFRYRIRFKPKKRKTKMNNKKENKKEKLYEFKYEKACICKDWKCDWRRSGDVSEHGIEDIPRYADVSEVTNFLANLHKYNNRLRKGENKIKLQRNCVCLRKVCPTRSGDFEGITLQDVSEDQENFI